MELPGFPVSRGLGVRSSSVEVVKCQKKLQCAAGLWWQGSSSLALLHIFHCSGHVRLLPILPLHLSDLSLSPFSELTGGENSLWRRDKGQRVITLCLFSCFNRLKWVKVESTAYQRLGKESTRNHRA